MRVTLPLERARVTVRSVANEVELQVVQRTLRGEGQAAETESWATWFRSMQLKLSAGELLGIADVVRYGLQREREHGARAGIALAPGQRTLYLRARRLLATDIGAARGIDPVEAHNWISAQAPA